MKKSYIKPAIIDLSIEGMTGFGYGVTSSNCVNGAQYRGEDWNDYCHSGSGHASSCSYGYAVANECNEGMFPYDSETVCVTGWSANGRLCWTGTSVTGFNPGCVSGSSGVSSGDCDGGPTANYCYAGSSNVGSFS